MFRLLLGRVPGAAARSAAVAAEQTLGVSTAAFSTAALFTETGVSRIAPSCRHSWRSGDSYQEPHSLWRRGFADRAEDEPEEEVRVVGTERVHRLAEQVMQLSLLEVADFTEILKKRLRIDDTPMTPMGYGAMPAAAPAAAAAPAEAAPPEEEKTEFDIKLDGFDAAAKIKVIKEVRGMTDLGLKEAKELVEGAPAVIKKAVKKEDAEELKKKLEAVGAKITLE